MKHITLLFCLLFSPYVLFSQLTDDEVFQLIQNGTEQQLVSENSRMMQENLLYHAEIVADKLLTLKPESSNYNYRKGFLVLEIRKDYMKAIPYLEKAILKTDANYDAYGVSEKSAPVDAFFHLATCHHLNEDIEKAKLYYNSFLTASKDKSELIAVTKLRLVQCERAIEAMANPVNARIQNIGNKIKKLNRLKKH